MQPKIIAHRGASAYVKENTLEAFEKAIALGADMVEFDVRRTRDKVLIIYHDPDLNQRPIRKLTYAEILAIDPTIPRLEEVLDVCQGKIHLDVELKEIGYEGQVLKLLLKFFAPDSFVMTSFHPFTVKRIKKKCPDVTTGFLFGDVTAEVCRSLRFGPKTVRDRIRRMRADFVAPDWQLLESELLSKVTNGSVPIWVWTVNAPEVLADLTTDCRIAGIITDVPDVGLQIRDRQHLKAG